MDDGRSDDFHNGTTIDIPAGTSLEDLERVAVEARWSCIAAIARMRRRRWASRFARCSGN